MSEITITKSREALALFEEKLKEAATSLDQRDRIVVERLVTLDGYVLKHPRGVFGLLFNGDDFKPNDNSKGNVVFMKRDMMIGVVSIIRYFENPKEATEKQPMMPAEYAELAADTLSGIEVFNNRPENERKIIPVRTELIDEDKGVWKYLTTFSIPLDFFETSIR